MVKTEDLQDKKPWSEISMLLLQKMSSQISRQLLKVQSEKFDQIVGTPQIGVEYRYE